MTSPAPWEYSPSENGSRDCIYDAVGNIVVFDVGHLDGPLIVRAVNGLPLLIEACRETRDECGDETHIGALAAAALAAAEQDGEA